MSCEDIEENRRGIRPMLKQNNFVTNTFKGVRNSGVPLETRLHEFNIIAVNVGEDGNCFFHAVSH